MEANSRLQKGKNCMKNCKFLTLTIKRLGQVCCQQPMSYSQQLRQSSAYNGYFTNQNQQQIQPAAQHQFYPGHQAQQGCNCCKCRMQQQQQQTCVSPRPMCGPQMGQSFNSCNCPMNGKILKIVDPYESGLTSGDDSSEESGN